MSTVLTGVGRGWGKIKTSESEQYVEKTSNKPLRQVRPIRFSKKCVSTVAASCQIFEEYDMHVFSHYQVLIWKVSSTPSSATTKTVSNVKQSIETERSEKKHMR